ncbi:MAG: hypothetical protein ABF289_13545 [Clostridiales bacterium]
MLKTDVILSIQVIASKNKKPIELIIDDTISKKAKPSSKDLNTIIGGQLSYFMKFLIMPYKIRSLKGIRLCYVICKNKKH